MVIPLIRTEHSVAQYLTERETTLARQSFAIGETGVTRDEFLDQNGWFDVSGDMVGRNSALKLGVVYRCIAAISETMGSLTLELKKYTDKTFKKATNYKGYYLYETNPNQHMTWSELISSATAQTLMHGNAYIRVFRDVFGYPTEFVLLKEGVCSPEIQDELDGRVKIVYYVNGQVCANYDIIHIKTLSSANPYVGESILSLARTAVDSGLEQQSLSYSINKNGLKLEGTIEVPTLLSDKAYLRLKNNLKEFRGAKKAAGTLFLEEGIKYSKMSMNPSDAQFVENRSFTVEDICRFFGVPPHKVMMLQRSTNNNIEHQDLEFYKGAILQWIIRFEQAFDKTVLIKSERIGRTKLVHKFDTSVLLRGDYKARAAFYNSLFPKAAISPDEIRAAEGLNPMNTKAMKATYMQLAMSDASELNENRGRTNNDPLANAGKKSEQEDEKEDENED